MHWFSLCPAFQNSLRCWHLSFASGPSCPVDVVSLPWELAAIPAPLTRGATADLGPALTLCTLQLSCPLLGEEDQDDIKVSSFVPDLKELLPPQCEGLVRLDARLPRHLEPSAHLPGPALTVSQPCPPVFHSRSLACWPASPLFT